MSQVADTYKMLERLGNVIFYLNPKVPCILWINTGTSSSDQFRASILLFKSLLLTHAPLYTNLGALVHIEQSGTRQPNEMLWSIREIESLNKLAGIKKIAFIIPNANEPLVNLSYILAAVAKSPMQVRMFGTQAAAENWLNA